MRTSSILVAVLVMLAGASNAHAQNAVPAAAGDAPLQADSVAPAHIAVASSMDRPAAVRRADYAKPNESLMVQSSKGLGEARAMMIVGGAAFVAGALIGGDAGTLVMVGGAAVGLYGLYEYLK
jgi:hypothetical protein